MVFSVRGNDVQIKPVLEQIQMAHLTHIYIQIRAVLLGDGPEKPKGSISRHGTRKRKYHLPSFFLIMANMMRLVWLLAESENNFFYPPYSHCHKKLTDHEAKESMEEANRSYLPNIGLG